MKEIAIKQRFYPTTEQAELLAQTFGCVRVVYNAILKWRTDAPVTPNEPSVIFNWKPVRSLCLSTPHAYHHTP